MSTLDDKLKATLEHSIWSVSRALRDPRNNKEKLLDTASDNLLIQIKQTLVGEGYLAPESYRIPPYYFTGQEWYERFEKELAEATKHWLFHSFDRQKVLEAAQKAAGLDD